MRITWEVEDGYCGKSSPQFTEINDDELEDYENEEEKEKFIEERVQEDFEQNISWCEINRE